jgi:hypothetical protein
LRFSRTSKTFIDADVLLYARRAAEPDGDDAAAAVEWYNE